MTHTSYLELSKSALKNNFDYLNRLVGSSCRVSHVVKGNAYGHGIKNYVPLAMELGADHFSTFDAFEAYEVNSVASGEVEVMIMGMIDNEELEWAVEKDIQFYLFEMDRLEAAIKAAKKVGKKAQVHLEFETGMNRTGFERKYWDDIPEIIKKNGEYLEVKGFCTHYAGAESFANFIRVNQQYDNFMEAVDKMHQCGLKAEILHSASSAATIRLPRTRMDLVRIGILQYGFWPNTETFVTTIQPQKKLMDADPLERIISWKSSIMSTKKVEQGDYIGYGTSYLAIHDMEIALVPVGYGYGFSRSLSNQGRALVRGQRVSVVGIVNMNAIMIDITEVEGVEKGDEVVLIGNQGDQQISVSSFGEYSDQLNYELLTRLPIEIPRRVVD